MEKKHAKESTKASTKTKPKKTTTRKSVKAKSATQSKSATKSSTRRVKAKAVPRRKPAAAKKAKTTTKAKHVTRSTAATKKTARAKPKTTKKLIDYTDHQKEELIDLIHHILDVSHCHQHGLKSLTTIAHILDHYNQRFTTAMDKFDAIVHYGMEKDPRVTQEYFYVLTDGRDKHTDDLYKLLGDISKHKLPFSEAKEQLKHLTTTAAKQHAHH